MWEWMEEFEIEAGEDSIPKKKTYLRERWVQKKCIPKWAIIISITKRTIAKNVAARFIT